MQPILQHLFKKNTLQEVPAETLKQITAEFPYFAVGQFLLTGKWKDSDDPGYGDQFQKTLVYFNNPLWLQYQLAAYPITVEGMPGIAENPEITEEPSDDTSQSAHDDQTEKVVFSKEIDFQNTGAAAITPEPALRTPTVELTNDHHKHNLQNIGLEEPFKIQAYHAVDYFASQGIKLSQESQQHDKLGKQLKSFTEWLKTMRRLPETSVTEVVDKINHGEIARIAAHSLEEKEIITEAMAEVLVKQHEIQKALELYHKLSLQSPHKSAYFAAKIGDLKQH